MNASQATNLCECELSNNGLGMTGRECDCSAGEKPILHQDEQALMMLNNTLSTQDARKLVDSDSVLLMPVTITECDNAN